MDRFWYNVRMTESCWLWRGKTHPLGYGVWRFKKKQDYAHRVSWVLSGRKIPASLQVAHKCSNPACVNPDHLFLASRSEISKRTQKRHWAANG